MTTILMTCPRCLTDITVWLGSVVLRVDVTATACGELIYECPECGRPSVSEIGSELLCNLLLAGARPLILGEPASEDARPMSPPFTADDLVTWRRRLSWVISVTPWE
ncbi:hypothetical protein OG984_09655 [Nocardioides sp. NBC_00368]|uniref:hypothetical protein n=1 Tax=Nocardioides sp. NBC_00368 TaxID=2976000 RepID=UPI002E1F9D17